MSNKDSQTVMIMAGEASGDFHGAALVRELSRLCPDLSFVGMGGTRMREAGVKMILPATDIAVVGLSEVLVRLPRIWKAIRSVRSYLQSEQPCLLILIDFPDFNLLVASFARKLGIKILYYISPQVWAWRGGRIRKIRKLVDKMAVILPFEEELYRRAGVDAVFVGHPLLDEVPSPDSVSAGRKTPEGQAKTVTIALLPGSRQKEMDRHLPVLLAAGEIIRRQLPSVEFVLAVAPSISDTQIEPLVSGHCLSVRMMRTGVYDALAGSDMAIVASGTASLETALMGKPMVIIYRLSWFSYLIGRLVVKVKHVGLANIIAGRSLVPELLQGQATPAAIARETLKILTDDVYRRRMEEDLCSLRNSLGEPGAARRTAALAADLIKSQDQP